MVNRYCIGIAEKAERFVYESRICVWDWAQSMLYKQLDGSAWSLTTMGEEIRD